MEKNTIAESSVSLVNVVRAAIQLPGVKVSREGFLRERFKGATEEQMKEILEKGPVEAGCKRDEVRKRAQALITDRTLKSTGASFAAGLPGGFAMALAIPADMFQFYGVALRLAQEIAYLYGEGDLWNGEILDEERITNQLILYCGVMLGSSGAAQTVRVLSSALAKQALKKLPQKALTKTFYYPVIKSIAKAFGAKMTKNVFAKGVSKAVPIIGGVVSGGITLATMRPMGTRLMSAMDEAKYDYTQREFEADWKDIMEICESEKNDNAEEQPSLLSADHSETDPGELMNRIQQAKRLLDSGAINETEFEEIKTRLISQI